MVTRVWIGSVDNNASNPDNWSPSGTPQIGDTLTMSGHTINVNASDLHGDTLTIDGGDGQPYTINLYGNAKATENTALGGGPVTINLAAHTKWVGGFTDMSAPVLVHGPGEFDNRLTQVTGGNAIIDTHVSYDGTFEVGPSGVLEFTKLVGAGQKVNVTGQDDSVGTLQIDHPKDFYALVNLGFGAVVLQDLVADSYTFKNDLLTFYADNKVVDRLRLHLDHRAVNLSVSQSGGNIDIRGDDTSDGTLLPLRST